jgi:hypothetical protein
VICASFGGQGVHICDSIASSRALWPADTLRICTIGNRKSTYFVDPVRARRIRKLQVDGCLGPTLPQLQILGVDWAHPARVWGGHRLAGPGTWRRSRASCWTTWRNPSTSTRSGGGAALASHVCVCSMRTLTRYVCLRVHARLACLASLCSCLAKHLVAHCDILAASLPRFTDASEG